MRPSNLSIVVCTKDRQDDLRRCVESIKTSLTPLGNVDSEVIIVDDGHLASDRLKEIRSILGEVACEVTYFNKSDNPGLLRSRKKGIQLAKHDLILFLDDDVVICDSYIGQLLEKYKMNEGYVGFGGVDTLLERKYGPLELAQRIFNRVFLLSSKHLGRLSLTGFSGGMADWPSQMSDFDTEYLSGCNMAFVKSAIESMAVPLFFDGYSLGEDLFISKIARRKGALLVSPDLKVKHFRSKAARDNGKEISKMRVINHFHLLMVDRPRPIRLAAFFWSILGITVRQALAVVLLGLLGKHDLGARVSSVVGTLSGVRSTLQYLSSSSKPTLSIE